ncbi:hypothetical protein EST38_g11109 [Candolleomyces aberdarensis]|uniref:F-box domain-containing protein n=1 Tax=Candolleomyces aberdarensis TaxID=2316362 RepID=A0A4Q2D5N8_9AGAR|nr:hypothetical protein EST38_g11109 [Candolleomyces aberdarensis]
MSGIGIINVLSHDVLEIILEELRRCDSWDHYCDMRLLCKTFNEILEPQVFFSVTIGFTEQNMNTVLDLLPRLASGTTPHARWARHLRVHNLVPLAEYGRSAWDRLKPGPIRERLLACQNEWLIPAIKALPRVEEVDASSREPYHPVLSSLAELPRLRSLKVWFNHPFQPSSDVPLSQFSNLETIELHDVALSTPILDSVKQLIANSPSLRKFAISKYRWLVNISTPPPPFVNFDTVIDDLLLAPTFTPTLKQLAIDAGGFHLHGSCIPFLNSLTHLDIRRLAHKGATPSFWGGLKHSDIRLQKLADTLQEICFRCAGRELWDVSGMSPWIIKESYLKALSFCPSLEHLDLVYFYPSPNEKVHYPTMPLDVLLATVSESLPRLQELGLMHVRNFHKYKSSGHDYEVFYSKVANAFTAHIRRSMYKCGKRLGFSLSAIGPSYTSSSGSTRYHIPVENDGLENSDDEEGAVSDSDADSVESYESSDGYYGNSPFE